MRDVWGIFVVYIDCIWGENECVMVGDMKFSFDELLDVVGVICYVFNDLYYFFFVDKEVSG